MTRRWTTAVLLLALTAPAAAEWTHYRADAGRTAYTDASLPADLHLHWRRRLPAQRPAWRDEGRMQFDRGYEPVVLEGKLLVASTVDDSLAAYDLATGEKVWRYWTGGPIRVAPAAWRDRVFVGSDDGLLHCVAARNGRRLWTFRGGPSDRRLVGNERVMATWPVRGGPAVADGTVYFTAGVWPFMGAFVHALDAETGRVRWTNDSTSFTWRLRPHPGAAAFAGLSPQGHVAVTEDRVLVPGSGSSPAVFDRADGRFVGYADNGGGTRVAGAGRLGWAGGRAFDLERGWAVALEGPGRRGGTVLAPDAWYVGGGTFDPRTLKLETGHVEVRLSHPQDGPTEKRPIYQGSIRPGGGPGKVSPYLRAGDTLVVSGRGGLQFVAAGDTRDRPEALWETKIEGRIESVLAAEGRLVVTTAEGEVLCYASGEPKAVRTHGRPAPEPLEKTKWADAAGRILKAAGAREGYALVWGLKDGGLVEELVKQSDLHVVAVDPDETKVAALRRRLLDAGVYGTGAAALVGDPAKMTWAPYLATLITSEEAKAVGLTSDSGAATLYRTLRPYGGRAVLVLGPESDAFAARAETAVAEEADLRVADGLTILTRPGPLPRSGDWRGQNADAGNTRCSRDDRVRAPLGVLWFGNALSNSLILPRHGEGPVEQVAGGRLFIEGPDTLSAGDVYTGRLLWTRTFEGIGKYYNITKHQRGAHAIGGNFFAVPDAVYVAAGIACHQLDPATGRTVRTLKLPGGSEWLFMLVYEDVLVAGADPIVPESKGRYNADASSRRLVVFDRPSGRVLWTRTAEESFGHYAVAAGRGKVFCIDKPSSADLARLARRGGEVQGGGRSILALEARTGELLWQSDRCVANQISYSAEHDVLVSAGALRGEDGSVLWDGLKTVGYAKHPNPGLDSSADPLWWGKWGLMIRGRTILTQGRRAFDLLTGVQRTVVDTGGEQREWRFRRFHGCGPSAGSRHLLTFRSGCAGFLDISADSGTGNLGGFRSGCTSNLIVADGVLNAPDYTRTCGCPYQNRSSLGLVHMPEVEYWTFGAYPTPGRIGLNFGAPGDRRDSGGTLWWDCPSAGSPSPELPAELEGLRTFYHHVSWLEASQGHPWVAASGLLGPGRVKVTAPKGTYTVRLHFVEPEGLEPGKRVFDVALGGRTVLEAFDPAREGGGARRGVVRTIEDVEVDGTLVVTFEAERGEAVCCGIELVHVDAPAAPTPFPLTARDDDASLKG